MSRVGMAKLGAVVAALIGVGVLALPAFAAVVASVRISGDPKVGATLTSEIALADPASTVEPTLRWQRCKQAKKGTCDPIKPLDGTRGATYTVREEDAGFWIGLKVQAPVPTPVPTPTPVPPDPPLPPEPPVTPLPVDAAAAAAETETTWSNFIGPVPGPTPTPTPEPTVDPDPDPDPPDDPPRDDEDEDGDDPPVFVQTGGPAPPVGAEPRGAGAEPLLRPYPVVRVKGTLVPGGARISLLKVRAPAGAAVDVRCGGPSCSLHRRATGSRRVRRSSAS